MLFSEKPMATSLADAQRIKEAAAKSKGIYNLGMNKRYGHDFKKVKAVKILQLPPSASTIWWLLGCTRGNATNI